MDDEAARRLLADAATTVSGSAGLVASAEQRYRRRRTRMRVLVGSTGALLAIAGGVAVLALRGSHQSARVTATPSTTNSGTATSAPTITQVEGAVDVRALQSLSFVDANTGFGVEGGAAGDSLVRSDDGGRTWRRVGTLAAGLAFVHFESATDGVAWGSGPLMVTRDSGVHWQEPDGGGPVDSGVAWSAGRLWSLLSCVQVSPCTPSLLRSDTAGQSWNAVAMLHQGFGLAAMSALSRDSVYVVEPAGDQPSGNPTELASTHDGGASWTFRSAPCPSGETHTLDLASNEDALMLICGSQPATAQQLRSIYVTRDDGQTWQQQSSGGASGTPAFLVSIGRTFVLGETRGEIRYSTDEGVTWQIGVDTSYEAGPSVDVLRGVGVFVATGRAALNAGVWFSSDGVHWERRAAP